MKVEVNGFLLKLEVVVEFLGLMEVWKGGGVMWGCGGGLGGAGGGGGDGGGGDREWVREWVFEGGR